MFKERTLRFLNKEAINHLIRDYGSPLLVFDESIIKTRYKEIKGALDILYPKNKIAYSVKTNYLPALISILKDAGALSEVVSGFEYWLVKKLGYRHEEIIYNGPDKSNESLEEALVGGAIV
ncbi:MAG TPA: diaminopimelate decarboxylase, partial [Candidatus Paceibacterota bacterium]